jgi:FAD synthase
VADSVSATEPRAGVARGAYASASPAGVGECKGGLFEGDVLHGDRLGRTIGFPTANIALGASRPSAGIYAARIRAPGEDWRDAVAYYGRRPTVDGKSELLEVFIFDFDQDIYGAHLTVDLVEFLRKDITFPDLDAMKLQIAEDCRAARRALRSPRPFCFHDRHIRLISRAAALVSCSPLSCRQAS